MYESFDTGTSRGFQHVIRRGGVHRLVSGAVFGIFTDDPDQVHHGGASFHRLEARLGIQNVSLDDLESPAGADLVYALSAYQQSHVVSMFAKFFPQRPAYVTGTACQQNLHCSRFRSVCLDFFFDLPDTADRASTYLIRVNYSAVVALHSFLTGSRKHFECIVLFINRYVHFDRVVFGFDND